MGGDGLWVRLLGECNGNILEPGCEGEWRLPIGDAAGSAVYEQLEGVMPLGFASIRFSAIGMIGTTLAGGGEG